MTWTEWRALADALSADIINNNSTKTTTDDVASLTSRLIKLKKQAEECYDALSPYERRRQADIIASLEASLNKKKKTSTSSNSSSKFSFSSRKRNKPTSSNPPPNKEGGDPLFHKDEEEEEDLAASSVNQSTTAIEDRRVSVSLSPDYRENVIQSLPEEVMNHASEATRVLEYITLSDLSDASSSSISLNNLNKCIVNLSSDCRTEEADTPSKSESIPALYLENIIDSVVIATNIKGSALIHNAVNCIFILKCHQFRMHTSSNIKVIIQTESTPIIEKCTSISIGQPAIIIVHNNVNVKVDQNKENELKVLDFDRPDGVSAGAGLQQNWQRMNSDDVHRTQDFVSTLRGKDGFSPEEVEIILRKISLVS